MLSWFRKRQAPAEPSPGLAERLALVETDLRALRRDLDDLDDSFRSWRGRESKREAREAARDEAPPSTLRMLPAAGGAPPSVNALRATGKWPFGR